MGAGLIRTTALTRRQTASVKARLKEPYLKFKCPAQLSTFVASNRCNYVAVYARNIMHSPFRRKLSLLLFVSVKIYINGNIPTSKMMKRALQSNGEELLINEWSKYECLFKRSRLNRKRHDKCAQ